MQKSTLALAILGFAASSAFAAEPVIGLITKTETNPFFVKMKEGAQAKATELGAKLLTGAGAKDGDNAVLVLQEMETLSQVHAAIGSGSFVIPHMANNMQPIHQLGYDVFD